MKETFAAGLVVLATLALAAQVPAVPEDQRVKTEDIDSVMAKGNVVVLDVREPKEIDELGGYEGAINIPLPQLEKRLGELPKEKTILTA
jgi:rhodanese-related sulfurtransferase